ncbi:PBSX family phage terminase large subunit [Corynebacterium glutamicum]|uniref:PBSX family phage terminase large subunit n=1 Tax=Corynebacterium glutamicum TaxID=1718 RepID=UPI001E2F0F6C|nr:PBSX family phage terminase large subunit [Corynebacterium glutamicum]
MTTDEDQVFGLSGKQKRAYAGSVGRVNIWDGAVRSGKTYAWTLLIIREVREYKGGAAILISGKNRDSIYRNVFEPIENDPNLALIRPFVHYRQGAPFAQIWGRKVHIVGANDEGSESRIRGMTIARAFSDEITITNKSFFKQLQARLSTRGSKMWATTNPDTPGHWLMKDYLSKIPNCRHFKETTPESSQLPHWTYWHFTMEDNPSLGEEYKASLRREYTGVWFRRFILGEWVAADGAIYDFFDTHTHVVDAAQIPAMQRVFALAVDYGTTHATAGHLLGLGIDGKLYVIDEWAPPRGTDGSLSADLMRKRSEWAEKGWSPEWTYHDPAAASFGLQLFEDGHPNVDKADNAVIDGIRTVASLLQSGDLLISSVCTNLINEIPGYVWDDKASEKGIEQPVKKDDDFCDSLRYVVTSSRWQWARYISR